MKNFPKPMQDAYFKLLDDAKKHGMDENALDEMVTDACLFFVTKSSEQDFEKMDDVITEQERVASEINNEGLSSQISFLLQRGYTPEMIKDEMGLK